MKKQWQIYKKTGQTCSNWKKICEKYKQGKLSKNLKKQLKFLSKILTVWGEQAKLYW